MLSQVGSNINSKYLNNSSSILSCDGCTATQALPGNN